MVKGRDSKRIGRRRVTGRDGLYRIRIEVRRGIRERDSWRRAKRKRDGGVERVLSLRAPGERTVSDNQ